MVTEILIEADLRVSISGPYFSRASIQGCRLQGITEEVKDFHERAFDYQMTGRASVLPNTLLTFWIEVGEFAGLGGAAFYIVQANPDKPIAIVGSSVSSYLKGPLEILAQSPDSMKAFRLRDWWFEWVPDNAVQLGSVARWLGEQIQQEDELPPLYPYPISIEEVSNTPAFDPVPGWMFESANPDSSRFEGLYK